MRRALSLVVLALSLATAVLATGQPKRPAPAARPAAKPGAKPAAPKPASSNDNPYDDAKPAAKPAADAGAAPGEPRAAEPGAGDAGALPTTPSGDEGDGGVRRSPLNPRPEEFPDGGLSAAPPVDFDRVLGDIARLRARVAAVGDTLFKSRLVLRVETRGDHAKIAKLAVTVDEGIVYTAPASFRAEDETVIYDHAVAPGRHVLGIEVDRRDDRGEGFRAAQTSRVTLDVPENQRLETTIRIDDDSDMAADFPGSQKGSYDLRVRVKARVKR